MIIIGVDYHPEFQQIASVDTESGEFREARLQHREEAERFYRELGEQRVQVRIGMEASRIAWPYVACLVDDETPDFIALDTLAGELAHRGSGSVSISTVSL